MEPLIDPLLASNNPTVNGKSETLNSAFLNYQQSRIEHWNGIAKKSAQSHGWGSFYHESLQQIYSFLIPPGQRVIEIGCAGADLLASVNPGTGVGVDFSEEMIQQARQQHPEFRFIRTDIHELELDEKFDVVILSDLLNDLWNVQTALQRIEIGRASCRERV